MRKNIYDILNSGNFDIRTEYMRIYQLFYNSNVRNNYGFETTLEGIVSLHFGELDKALIGRCLSLKDFNYSHNFSFPKTPVSVSIETLLMISEYVLSFGNALYDKALIDYLTYERIKDHILSCMLDAGFAPKEMGLLVIFVENKPEAFSVAEIVDEKLSYSVLEYNHYRLKGDLDRKKKILFSMHNNIVPMRPRLKTINGDLESILFALFNKFVRHDSNGNEIISNMLPEEIEKMYDEIYQIWLLAKLYIDYYDKKELLKETISEISKKS